MDRSVEVDGSRLEVFGPMVALAELANADGADEILRKMKHVAFEASACEYAMFGMQVTSRYMPEPLTCVARDYPAGFSERYFNSGWMLLDPTVAHCQVSTEPLVWRPDMYSGKSEVLLEGARAAGLEHGISVAYHESADVKSMISFARDKPFDDREIRYLLSLAQVTIACAHLAAKRTAIPRLVESLRNKLSPRELQCIELLCEGKSNSVMAQIMGISEGTIEFHLRRLYDKLKVATRYQAMAVGLQLLQGYTPTAPAADSV